MSQPATGNCQLPICNRGQLAVGKLTSELIEIPQQSGATNGGATCRLMQLPKFVFVLMKFFPLHKTHSNLTIDEVMLPPLSSSLSPFDTFLLGQLLRAGAVQANLWQYYWAPSTAGRVGRAAVAEEGDKIYAASDAIELSNENESDNEVHFTAAGGCAEMEGEGVAG